MSNVLHPGSGSDARRKGIMNRALGDSQIFVNLWRVTRDGFKDRSKEMQEKLQTAATLYLNEVRETLDLVRSERAARESEGDPELRRLVEEAMVNAENEMERIQGLARGGGS